MLKVDDHAKIRLAHRDGMSIREIARAFRHSPRKIREILAQPAPTPYTRTKPPPAPVLGSFHQTIDAILAADEDAPAKQRHTAMHIFRRLSDEHSYKGGYDQVRRYVGKHRRSTTRSAATLLFVSSASSTTLSGSATTRNVGRPWSAATCVSSSPARRRTSSRSARQSSTW